LREFASFGDEVRREMHVLDARAAEIADEWRDRVWSDEGGNPELPVIENDWDAVRRRLGR